MRRSGFAYGCSLSALVAISLLALAAFAVRAASLDAQSLWRDEVDALRFATAPWAEMLSNFTRPGWNGPLYFLLLRGWIALTGSSEYAMRFFSLAFGVLCVPLVYVLGRRLFNRQTGLLAALLTTASPYLTWYGQEVKMYTLVPALALLAIYSLCRAVEGPALSLSKGQGWRWWAVQVVATSLAFYSHILAVLLVPVQVLLYFAWWPQARRRWRGALISLACLTLPYLPLVAWQAEQVLQERETGFYPYTLGEMAEILLNGWSLGILGRSWPWGMVLMSALAVWGLLSPLFLLPLVGGGAGGVRGRLALLGWLVIPLLIVWLISLRQPLFTDRYFIWAAPAFYLLIASGLASFWRFGGWGRWAVTFLTGIILVVNGINLWQQATSPIKADFRAAAACVADYHTSDEPTASQVTDRDYPFKCYLPLAMRSHTFDELIIFQIPYSKHAFDYYFPEDEYPWAEGLYTNHRDPDGSYLMSEQEVAQLMREMTAGQGVIWLVATETAMWDERGLVQAWLEANWQRVDEEDFAQVDVYRYVKRDE